MHPHSPLPPGTAGGVRRARPNLGRRTRGRADAIADSIERCPTGALRSECAGAASRRTSRSATAAMRRASSPERLRPSAPGCKPTLRWRSRRIHECPAASERRRQRSRAGAIARGRACPGGCVGSGIFSSRANSSCDSARGSPRATPAERTVRMSASAPTAAARPRNRGEMLGDRRRRAVGVLERVRVRAYGVGSEVLDGGVLAEEGEQRAVHAGVRAARLQGALTSGDLRSAHTQAARVDDVRGDRCYASGQRDAGGARRACRARRTDVRVRESPSRTCTRAGAASAPRPPAEGA